MARSSPGKAENSIQDQASLSTGQAGTVGLYNLGNSGYLNATIQCLAHLNMLYASLRQATHKTGSIAAVCEELMTALRTSSDPESTPISPSAFRRKLVSVHPAFSRYRQQDARELCAFLLDELHTELCDPVNGHSPIQDIFQGKYTIRRTCSSVSCAETTQMEVDFKLLTLPLPRARSVRYVPLRGGAAAVVLPSAPEDPIKMAMALASLGLCSEKAKVALAPSVPGSAPGDLAATEVGKGTVIIRGAVFFAVRCDSRKPQQLHSAVEERLAYLGVDAPFRLLRWRNGTLKPLANQIEPVRKRAYTFQESDEGHMSELEREQGRRLAVLLQQRLRQHRMNSDTTTISAPTTSKDRYESGELVKQLSSLVNSEHDQKYETSGEGAVATENEEEPEPDSAIVSESEFDSDVSDISEVSDVSDMSKSSSSSSSSDDDEDETDCAISTDDKVRGCDINREQSPEKLTTSVHALSRHDLAENHIHPEDVIELQFLTMPAPKVRCTRAVRAPQLTISVTDCIDSFKKSNPTLSAGQEDFNCPRCGGLGYVSERELSKAPPVLVLHIERFGEAALPRSKLSEPVSCPLDLKLPLSGGMKSVQYKLRAILRHRGSLNNGYYDAYIRVGDVWMLFDDSRVEEVPVSDIKCCLAPYLVFYEQSESSNSSTSDAIGIEDAAPGRVTAIPDAAEA